MAPTINPQRIRLLRDGIEGTGPILHWMGRDMRAQDNWALLHAQALALERGAPLIVCFALAPNFLDATRRQYDFLLKGLEEVEETLAKKRIPFVLLSGDPAEEIIRFSRKLKARLIVTDFEPLAPRLAWKRTVVRALRIPVIEVDAHNCVPCWIASPKREYGAYTIRPKIMRVLDDFLDPFPKLRAHPFSPKEILPHANWKRVHRSLRVEERVTPVDWIMPGERAAHRMLARFIRSKLTAYDAGRNDPTKDAQSNLSPYIHFGQISAQRIVQQVIASGVPHAVRAPFIEELVVRRELSDNFCHFTARYDRLEAAPEWARVTLAHHARDARPYRYNRKQFESARTHDALWNAAQMEMVLRGKMHGYMRMYWAKKILEWSTSPQQAIRIAIALNDRYELDGRDPNGYTGILWSIAGLHDRAWGERAVFGKIRYMSANGCRSKFDANTYIQDISRLRP